MEIKKALFITPVAGKTFSQVMAEQDEGLAHCKSLGFYGMDALFTDEPYTESRLLERGIVNRDLFLFAKTIEQMSMCSAVHFSEDCFEDARTAALMEISDLFAMNKI